MAYPFPGYLDRTADLAGNLLSGFQAGAQVSEAQSRLQAEAQRVGIETAERQQQLQAEQARQSQMLAMTKAYHDAQIGLRRSQLEQAQQKIQLATQTTARRLAEQEGYRQRYNELAPQIGPVNAARQAMLEHAGMFSSGAGLADVTKQMQPQVHFGTQGEVKRYDPQKGTVEELQAARPGSGKVSPFDTGDYGRISGQILKNEVAIDKLPDPSKQADDLRNENFRLHSQLKEITDKYAPSNVAAKQQTPQLPKVTTQSEFDALPSGAVYISKNGKKHRKP